MITPAILHGTASHPTRDCGPREKETHHTPACTSAAAGADDRCCVWEYGPSSRSCVLTAFEPRGKHPEDFQDFHPKFRTRIWLRLSFVPSSLDSGLPRVGVSDELERA